jgi:hypothetical protein
MAGATTLATGWAFLAVAGDVTLTFRTSRPVRGSARTTDATRVEEGSGAAAERHIAAPKPAHPSLKQKCITMF